MDLSRSSLTGLVSINTLPAEILVRIFHLVLNTHYCAEGEGMLLPKYPDLLSHVCSRWRDIVVNSGGLWSHIDLAPCHINGSRLLARGVVCAARASHSPLYLHVIHLQHHVDYSEHSRNAHEEFLVSAAAQIKSLELVVKYGSPEGDRANEISILESLIGKCVPGTLTQLIATNRTFGFFNFIQADGHEIPAPNSTSLGLSHELLENLWGPITVLRLNGLYPYWSSTAYHGLTELRLTSYGDPDVAISESQLVGMLTSSPGLRIFQFDCSMRDPRPIGALVATVRLDYLEVLSVSGLHYSHLEYFLRWLAPGSNPLQVSIADSYQTVPLASIAEVQKFLARSNITKLHYGPGEIRAPFSEIAKLLELLPNLRILAIDKHFCDNGESHQDERVGLTAPSRLGYLCMLNCIINVNDLQRFLKGNPVQTLEFWNCLFSFTREGEARIDTTGVVRESLSTFCPIIHFIAGNEPSPIENWK